MEAKREKFIVNNYIVFRHGPDCYEGRIKNITIDGALETYIVFCFTTFMDLKVSSTEIIYNVSQEVKRKMRITAYNEVPGQTYIPVPLRNVLVVDKEWSITNKYDLPFKNNITSIMKYFKEFLVNSACICDTDEANEVHKGFISSFNAIFKRYLMYSNEWKEISLMKGEPVEYCGAIHLLRYVYYVQKNIETLVKDRQARNILLDYTIYLLDFLLLKYKDYF